MKSTKKFLIFLVLLFLISQLSFHFFMPTEYIYNGRLTYDVFKDNVYSIDATVKAIKSIIKMDKLENYVILIGDSVGYGTPCPTDKTISFYMNNISKINNSKIRVFNVAIPSTMFGDFYTIIKLLENYDISTQNLIINFSYWEINAKTPTYWFRHYLKDLDKESYAAMVDNGHIKKESLWKDIKSEIYHFANKNISLIGYSGFITNKIKETANTFFKQPKSELKAWSLKKKRLTNMLALPENRWYYTDKKFNLGEDSPQIYFLNKISENQKGKNTLFVLNAMNDDLLAEASKKEGYIANLTAISKCFSDRGLKFIDYNKKVDYKYFSDHVHLLPDGYQFLADDLWKQIQKEIN